MYTWHFTFDGQSAVHNLAAAYQEPLSALPGLDLIPARWLHLTTQGVGFTDQVTGDEADAIIKTSRDRLAGFASQRVTLGPARVTPEAILLDVSPAAGLAAIRNELRAAIAGVLGRNRLMESDEWTPHVSIAYSNGTAAAAPYEAAVAGGSTAGTVISTVELIVLGRDRHLYEWTTRAGVALTGGDVDAMAGALR